MKRIMRLAAISGKGIRKRCRKEDFIYVEAQGETDFEALNNLRLELDKFILTMKSYEFKDVIKVYNIEIDGYCTSRPVFPNASDKLALYDWNTLEKTKRIA